jgi:cytochrome oxidase Cu insertion factor (SCO1/SenC/PrrC family)
MDAIAPGTPSNKTMIRLSPAMVLALGVLIILICLLGLFAFRLLVDTTSPLAVGQPAPEFQLDTFDGEQISLSDLRGQGVVVNF